MLILNTALGFRDLPKELQDLPRLPFSSQSLKVMATHLKRTVTCQSLALTYHDGALTVHWETPPKGNSVRAIERHRNPSRFKSGPLSSNPFIPPCHWHWYQDEFFQVTEGRFIFTLEGKEVTVSAGDSPVRVPAKTCHTFRADSSSEEDCVVEVSAEPGEAGLSESFFRNLFGYLDDCEKQKVKPSLPQLLLLLDSVGASVAIPGPAPLMQWVSYCLGVVVGRWFGGYVLGYKATYDEYYDVKMAKKA